MTQPDTEQPVKHDLTPDEWTEITGTKYGAARVMPVRMDDGTVHATQAWVTDEGLVDADGPATVDYDHQP